MWGDLRDVNILLEVAIGICAAIFHIQRLKRRKRALHLSSVIYAIKTQKLVICMSRKEINYWVSRQEEICRKFSEKYVDMSKKRPTSD